jgi:hypothetical protein
MRGVGIGVGPLSGGAGWRQRRRRPVPQRSAESNLVSAVAAVSMMFLGPVGLVIAIVFAVFMLIHMVTKDSPTRTATATAATATQSGTRSESPRVRPRRSIPQWVKVFGLTLLAAGVVSTAFPGLQAHDNAVAAVVVVVAGCTLLAKRRWPNANLGALRRVSPALAPAAAPQPHFTFNAPPGWPPPPVGWAPTPGWEPDSSWPAAPDGWVFWTPVAPAI